MTYFQFWKRKEKKRKGKNSTYSNTQQHSSLVSDSLTEIMSYWKKKSLNKEDYKDSLEGVKSFLDSKKSKTQTASLWKDEDWDYLLLTNQVIKEDLQRAKKERKQRKRPTSVTSSSSKEFI